MNTTAPSALKPVRPSWRAIAALPLVALAGCASVPDVTLHYRPVDWSVAVSLVHVVTCAVGDARLTVSRDALLVPSYFAGGPDERFQLRLKDLDGLVADANVKIAFSEDGRLKSLNHEGTGVGKEVAEQAVGLLAILGGPKSMDISTLAQTGSAEKQSRADATKRACAIVRGASSAATDKAQQLTLVLRAELNQESQTLELKPAVGEQALLESLSAALVAVGHAALRGQVSASLRTPDSGQRVSVAAGGGGSQAVPLTLQRSGELTITVSDGSGTVGSRVVAVPRKVRPGQDGALLLTVPIPKAALFGKVGFSLALSDSGRIAEIGYTKTSGAAAALGAASAMAGDDAKKAAQAKAEADLIYQRQRLALCEADPASCKN